MRYKLRLAIRDWDFMTPIVVGDVRSPDFDVVIDRRDALLGDFTQHPDCDGAEISFGRYARARATGDESVVGVPHFLMRAFRHRCIITSKASPIRDLAGLAGKSIGLDGWPDSGHVWTRGLLRRAGVRLQDVMWRVGPLTPHDPVRPHAAGLEALGSITELEAGQALVDMLEAGTLDAAFAPFMPPGFDDADSTLRPLLADYRTAEVAYFHDVGYVPGIHILALTPAIVAAHPTMPMALSELIDESTRLWRTKRKKYAESTPWMIDELARSARDLPAGWDDNGYAANEAMVDAFAGELFAQKLTAHRLDPRRLFPHFAA